MQNYILTPSKFKTKRDDLWHFWSHSTFMVVHRCRVSLWNTHHLSYQTKNYEEIQSAHLEVSEALEALAPSSHPQWRCWWVHHTLWTGSWQPSEFGKFSWHTPLLAKGCCCHLAVCPVVCCCGPIGDWQDVVNGDVYVVGVVDEGTHHPLLLSPPCLPPLPPLHHRCIPLWLRREAFSPAWRKQLYITNIEESSYILPIYIYRYILVIYYKDQSGSIPQWFHRSHSD